MTNTFLNERLHALREEHDALLEREQHAAGNRIANVLFAVLTQNHAAGIALRRTSPERNPLRGAFRHQRHVQRRSHVPRRRMRTGGACRRRRPANAFYRHRREARRTALTIFPLPEISGSFDARSRRPADQCVRHASDGPRGRMDLHGIFCTERKDLTAPGDLSGSGRRRRHRPHRKISNTGNACRT